MREERNKGKKKWSLTLFRAHTSHCSEFWRKKEKKKGGVGGETFQVIFSEGAHALLCPPQAARTEASLPPPPPPPPAPAPPASTSSGEEDKSHWVDYPTWSSQAPPPGRARCHICAPHQWPHHTFVILDEFPNSQGGFDTRIGLQEAQWTNKRS